jgi:hypothetical protein
MKQHQECENHHYNFMQPEQIPMWQEVHQQYSLSYADMVSMSAIIWKSYVALPADDAVTILLSPKSLSSPDHQAMVFQEIIISLLPSLEFFGRFLQLFPIVWTIGMPLHCHISKSAFQIAL